MEIQHSSKIKLGFVNGTVLLTTDETNTGSFFTVGCLQSTYKKYLEIFAQQKPRNHKSSSQADMNTLEYEVGVEKFLMSSVHSTSPSSSGFTSSEEHIPDAASEMPNTFEAAYNNKSGDDYDKETYEFKSDNAFTELLSYAGSLLSTDHVLPVNAYEVKKTLSSLGLEYKKIHVCPDECILYRGINVDASKCPKCHVSRWKTGKDGKPRNNISAKVMWYFPIIPRFRRMFKSPSTAKILTWHAEQRVEDGMMRHPADSSSWRNIDYKWPYFSSEVRNIRLALVADGINPHNNGLTNSEEVSTDIEDLQRIRNKASTDVSNASTDNIHQRISASTDKALTARASTDKAISG
ncbi:hypothetical protein AgCh_016800 [Apium graveolens]